MTSFITKIIDLIGRLPYFPGKGVFIILIFRLLNLKLALPICLPDRSRVLISGDDLHWIVLIWLGKYQPEFTRMFWYLLSQIPPNSTVIDIGAHMGYYSLQAARYLLQRGGTVFAFEPHPAIFSNLKQNKEINHLHNLILVQSAVYNKVGEMQFFATPHTGYSSLSCVSNYNQVYKVKTTTLDKFVILNNIHQVKLIKIDAEGAELPILQGSEYIIMRDRPYIIYEENENTCRNFGYSVEELRKFLHKLKYDISTIDTISYYSNALAIPK